MEEDEHKYTMSITLYALKHMGAGLYSSMPAVLSEAVANAWDADATRVDITTDFDVGTITIEDNGHGMDVADANEKYLSVGYERRIAGEGITPRLKRKVMGRKGIGKLSLFAIAKTVTVHSVKEGATHGFVMDEKDIEEAAKNRNHVYHPDAVVPGEIDIEEGTRIILSNLKQEKGRPGAMVTKIARRFSVIGESDKFDVSVNGNLITPEDRNYHRKLQYVWAFGWRGRHAAGNAKAERRFALSPEVRVGSSVELVDGWIGTAEKAGDMREPETKESINEIAVMVRGKMAQDDVLKEIGEGGMYSKYLIGEIIADFLDRDEDEDISTTGREHIKKDSERYRAVVDKIREDLKTIQSKWTELRNEEGKGKALEIPQIKEWYEGLPSEHKSVAKKLFGKINQLTIESDDTRRRLFVSSILAFEALKLRNLLDRLNEINVNNLETVNDIFVQLDDLEASAYYQITRGRLEVIRELNEAVDENTRERVIQNHLFKHLWLLDPSWERAAQTERMESRVEKAFDSINAGLSEEQRNGRLDIKYKTTGNKHVVIELKRPGVTIDSSELQKQVKKYRGAVLNILKDQGKSREYVEFVCVVGRDPKDWGDYDKAEEESRDALEKLKARIVKYDELINNAQMAYQDYTAQKKNVARTFNLIREIALDDGTL